MPLTEAASSARDSLAAPLRRLSARVLAGRSSEAPPTEAESFYGQRKREKAMFIVMTPLDPEGPREHATTRLDFPMISLVSFRV